MALVVPLTDMSLFGGPSSAATGAPQPLAVAAANAAQQRQKTPQSQVPVCPLRYRPALRLLIKGPPKTGKTTLYHRLRGRPPPTGYYPSEAIEVASINWASPHDGEDQQTAFSKSSPQGARIDVWDVVEVGTAKPHPQLGKGFPNIPRLPVDCTTVDIYGWGLTPEDYSRAEELNITWMGGGMPDDEDAWLEADVAARTAHASNAYVQASYQHFVKSRLERETHAGCVAKPDVGDGENQAHHRGCSSSSSSSSADSDTRSATPSRASLDDINTHNEAESDPLLGLRVAPGGDVDKQLRLCDALVKRALREARVTATNCGGHLPSNKPHLRSSAADCVVVLYDRTSRTSFEAAVAESRGVPPDVPIVFGATFGDRYFEEGEGTEGGGRHVPPGWEEGLLARRAPAISPTHMHQLFELGLAPTTPADDEGSKVRRKRQSSKAASGGGGERSSSPRNPCDCGHCRFWASRVVPAAVETDARCSWAIPLAAGEGGSVAVATKAFSMAPVLIPFALTTGLGMRALHRYLSSVLDFAVIKEAEASIQGMYERLSRALGTHIADEIRAAGFNGYMRFGKGADVGPSEGGAPNATPANSWLGEEPEGGNGDGEGNSPADSTQHHQPRKLLHHKRIGGANKNDAEEAPVPPAQNGTHSSSKARKMRSNASDRASPKRLAAASHPPLPTEDKRALDDFLGDVSD